MDPVEELFVRTKGVIRPGLDRVLRAYDKIGRPLDGIRTILIAGTNGKGTTAAFTATLLRRSGLSVALYSSPHLIDYTERLWIDGFHPDRKLFCDTLKQLETYLDREGFTELSFFEIFTLISFIIIGQNKPEIAVVEVGLGGKWDATNIVDPDISIITGVALDHQEFLGSNLADIAREKMGIARSGRPLVWGGGGLLRANPEIESQCLKDLTDSGARVFRRDQDFGRKERTVWISNGLRSETLNDCTSQLNANLPDFLLDNMSLAYAAANYLFPERSAQLKSIAPHIFNGGIDWPKGQRARYETLSVFWRGRRLNFLLDVCHNPDGASALVKALSLDIRFNNLENIPALVSILKDKDYIEILTSISEVSESITAFRSNSPRSWDEGCLRQWATGQIMYQDFVTALDHLLDSQTGELALILVCGSVHAVGEVLSWIENLNKTKDGYGTR